MLVRRVKRQLTTIFETILESSAIKGGDSPFLPVMFANGVA